MRKLQQSGFTLTELMLAMAVFSMVLTLCLSIFVQINRLYYRGLTITQAQEASRSIVSDMSTLLRSGTYKNGNTLAGGGTYFCIDDRIYSVRTGIRAKDAPGVKVLATWTDAFTCLNTPAGVSVPAGSNSLISEEVSIHGFTVTQGSIDMTVGVGAITEFENPGTPVASCRPGSSQFCGVSRLSATVIRRTK